MLAEDLSGNPHVQRGIREEPIARQRFEERHGVMLLPLCAESSEEPIMRASFDGLTDDGRPVELKAPSLAKFRELQENGTASELYQRYFAQIQAQIYVAAADTGYLSFHFGDEFLDIEVGRDDDFINRLLDAARTFWQHIKTGKEPALDPERDMYIPNGTEHESWLRLAAEYRQLDDKLADYTAQTKALEKTITELEKQFLSMMGEFTLAESSGVRISRYLQQGSVDYKAALKAIQPDVIDSELERFRRKASERVRITLRADEDLRAEVPFDPDALKKAAGPDAWF